MQVDNSQSQSASSSSEAPVPVQPKPAPALIKFETKDWTLGELCSDLGFAPESEKFKIWKDNRPYL